MFSLQILTPTRLCLALKIRHASICDWVRDQFIFLIKWYLHWSLKDVKFRVPELQTSSTAELYGVARLAPALTQLNEWFHSEGKERAKLKSSGENEWYLEWCGRVWVHLDHWGNQNHSSKISGPLTGRQDRDGTTLNKNKQRIYVLDILQMNWELRKPWKASEKKNNLVPFSFCV